MFSRLTQFTKKMKGEMVCYSDSFNEKRIDILTLFMQKHLFPYYN